MEEMIENEDKEKEIQERMTDYKSEKEVPWGQYQQGVHKEEEG